MIIALEDLLAPHSLCTLFMICGGVTSTDLSLLQNLNTRWVINDNFQEYEYIYSTIHLLMKYWSSLKVRSSRCCAFHQGCTTRWPIDSLLQTKFMSSFGHKQKYKAMKKVQNELIILEFRAFSCVAKISSTLTDSKFNSDWEFTIVQKGLIWLYVKRIDLFTDQ